MFSSLAPNETNKLVHEIADAPAPFTTIRTSSIFFAAISKALINAAPVIILASIG